MGKRLTDEGIRDLVNGKEPWYTSKLVYESYCGRAAKYIYEKCEKTKKIPFIDVDQKCTYNKREEREKRRTDEKVRAQMQDQDGYITATNRHEERMCHILFVQQYVSDYEVLDYQIPTRNGGHDKIDLLLKKGDEVFMTETKKFSQIEKDLNKEASKETILRCVLEIQTYYQKLNEKFYEIYEIDDKTKLKKAVLVDEYTQAFKQFKNEKWAKEILELFDIKLLKLDRKDKTFTIQQIL